MKLSLDDLDHKILQILENDGRAPAKFIAEKLSINEVTVSKRLAKIIDGGFCKVIAIADFEKCGYDYLLPIGIRGQGEKLEEVAEFLSQQKEVFKPYIEECTRLRIANAENPFKKSFFKSLICSLYGRMAMKAYSGLQIFFCNKNKIIFDKYSKHPNLHSFKRIDKDLCLFYLTPRSAPKNQFPQYAFSILEVSKACMYDSFYFTFKIILPDIKCHMTDTDRYVFFHTRLIIYVSLKKCYYSFLCSFSTPSLPETLKNYRQWVNWIQATIQRTIVYIQTMLSVSRESSRMKQLVKWTLKKLFASRAKAMHCFLNQMNSRHQVLKRKKIKSVKVYREFLGKNISLFKTIKIVCLSQKKKVWIFHI